MNYTVDVAHYRGPIGKLLELVEAEKFDINSVSLAKVTGGFLEYLEGLESAGIPHGVLADFLVVASKLLLIKSKILIPEFELEKEEEEDIRDLEVQLKFYRQIKKLQPNIADVWSDLPKVASREFLMVKKALFYPPKRFTVKDLQHALEKVVHEIEKFMPVEVVEREVVNLRKKIEEMVRRLSETPVSFQ